MNHSYCKDTELSKNTTLQTYASVQSTEELTEALEKQQFTSLVLAITHTFSCKFLLRAEFKYILQVPLWIAWLKQWKLCSLIERSSLMRTVLQ